MTIDIKTSGNPSRAEQGTIKAERSTKVLSVLVS